MPGWCISVFAYNPPLICFASLCAPSPPSFSRSFCGSVCFIDVGQQESAHTQKARTDGTTVRSTRKGVGATIKTALKSQQNLWLGAGQTFSKKRSRRCVRFSGLNLIVSKKWAGVGALISNGNQMPRALPVRPHYFFFFLFCYASKQRARLFPPSLRDLAS